jgi:serine/threonine protein kinase
MALTIGTQFGSHEITALLGKGGMGEVYRARDLKLKREVAIKVLPEEFSRDADRLSRFQREAEVLASLNHPNIATIYDLEEVSGSRYLVLELVEGETLEDRLKHGALPVEEALNIAKSICEALEAAHEKGIVHRDLKPANVTITPDGKVKVLDFGLAKAMDNAPANAALSNSPTMMTGTLGGVILGTAAYMSPEQARGKPVDRRADIWAFGVVLYELLTAKLPFEGEDVTEILAAVVKERPDLSVIPANLRPLIERCLEKDPKKRLRDIGDVWAVVEAQAQTVGPPFLHRLLWPVIAALAGTVAVSVSLIHFREKAPRPPQLMRFQIYPPENGDFGSSSFSSVDVSHDGRRLAYIARGQDGRSRIWIRELGSVESHPLTGTEEAVILWWSPDDRYLAFRSGVELKKIESSGGIPQTLCECLVVAQGAWNEDGTILFSSGHGIVKIPSSGGDASPVTTLNLSRGESIHFLPSFLPDGRHFLYFRGSATADDSGLFAGSLDLKPDQQPLSRLLDVPGRYVASSNSTEGYVMFSRGDSLFLQPFNKNRLRLDGDPTIVADNTNALNSYSASAEGMLAYTNNTGLARFTWLDRNGKVLGAMGEPAIQGNPNISRRLAQLRLTETVPDRRISGCTIQNSQDTALRSMCQTTRCPCGLPVAMTLSLLRIRTEVGDFIAKAPAVSATKNS